MAESTPHGAPPTPQPEFSDAPALDGRRRRSQRSRERILDAVARAVSDPETILTPERIAARAGVSMSTIFRHFGDMNGLADAMRERISRKVTPYFMAGPFEGDTRKRLRELLRRRSAIYEMVGPFQRASLRQLRRPRGARALQARFTAALQAQTTAALELELQSDPGVAQIVETLLSIGAWTHMRVDQGLSVDAATSLLERAVLAQLAVETT